MGHERLAGLVGFVLMAVLFFARNTAEAWSTVEWGSDGGLLSGEPVDANTATKETLAGIPGIGPTRAAAIVEARNKARFRSFSELDGVRGIGEGTLAQVAPFLAVPTDPSVPTSKSTTPPPITRIDLNRATAAELEDLPGIGPAIAARILEERSRKPFRTVADLVRVKGIGPKNLERLRERVTVSP